MFRSEVLVRPAAELAREKTLAAIRVEQKQGRQRRQNGDYESKEQCEVIKDLPTFENEVHNTSPNATNIAGGA